MVKVQNEHSEICNWTGWHRCPVIVSYSTILIQHSNVWWEQFQFTSLMAMVIAISETSSASISWLQLRYFAACLLWKLWNTSHCDYNIWEHVEGNNRWKISVCGPLCMALGEEKAYPYVCAQQKYIRASWILHIMSDSPDTSPATPTSQGLTAASGTWAHRNETEQA